MVAAKNGDYQSTKTKLKFYIFENGKSHRAHSVMNAMDFPYLQLLF